MDAWLWVRIRFRHLLAALNALKAFGTEQHQHARTEDNPAHSAEYRAEADEALDAYNVLWQQRHGGTAVRDESVSGNSGPLQITRVELPQSVERTVTWIIPTLIALMLVIGACGLVMGLNLAKQAQEDRDFKDAALQSKLVERRLMDIEAYAMLNGWKVPGDDTHGPTGNFERMKPKEKSDGRR